MPTNFYRRNFLKLAAFLAASGVTPSSPSQAQGAMSAPATGSTRNQRHVLSDGTTFYVRAGGSDVDDHLGLEDTDADAWATVDYAVDRISAKYDFAGQTVTVSIQNGTTTTAIDSRGYWVGGGTIDLDFNGGTINVTGAPCITFGSSNAHYFRLKNVTLTGTDGISIFANTVLEVLDGVNFGAVTASHIFSDDTSTVFLYTDYTISGGGASHLYAYANSFIQAAKITITLTGTPVFGDFAVADIGKLRHVGCTFTGAATGNRYFVDNNTILTTGGGGANYFPGDSPGRLRNGGVYT